MMGWYSIIYECKVTVKNSKGRTVGIWLKKKKRPNTCRSFTSKKLYTYFVVGECWIGQLN